MRRDRLPEIENATWYKDAIFYEVHVKAFFDSVTDGIGDFGGLTQKLDYLQNLGITAIWLLPFCPSPLRDDGYDISNYTDIHSSYGTLREFQRFLREAHRRGLRVVTELVLNHTSDQHVWFQRARRAPANTRWRNFYVWSETPEKYREARVIFKDFETSNWTWDPVAKAYYWHRFYSHQPDLNFDNPEVRTAMFDAMDFWFDLGVDGLRLDAVPYLFERDSTNCENLPETHAFLKELRGHVDAKYKDRMLLAEANQWPEDAVAYFGEGNECHMALHFPLMPRLFMASRMEDRYPITDILRLTPSIPENCQWALFLRNHDELTLEMVTDEERDYMYRTYASDREMRINLGIRRRLAPLLENDRRKIELMNALLFSLPGTPIVYYGDEIGMGDNVYLGDRDGVRTPMQWSADRNAGFSRANPQRLYLPVNIDPEYHYETINVESQQNNSHSLLWWMKRMIAQRKQFRSFGRGSLEFLQPSNRRVLAFVRQLDDEIVLVVANLSRFAQCTDLDLAKFRGMAPTEVFGRTRFPAITDRPYFLSLGPHAFYWLHLEPATASSDSVRESGDSNRLPTFAVESWEKVFSVPTLRRIEGVMPSFLQARRWFLGGRRTLQSAEITEILPLQNTSAQIALVKANYSDGDPDTYLLSLAVAIGEKASKLLEESPDIVVARLQMRDGTEGILYAAMSDMQVADALLGAVVRRRKLRGTRGVIIGMHTRRLREIVAESRDDLDPAMLKADQSNSSVLFGNTLILKFFRKVEPGINPDREMQEFLTDKAGFSNMSHYLGCLEYRPSDPEQERITLAVLSKFTRAELSGWNYTIDNLSFFFERVLALGPEDPRLRDLLACATATVSEQQLNSPSLNEVIGPYLENVRLLGQRTAELHLALASHPEIPAFAPEPFTDFYRLSLYHGMLGRMTRCFEQVRSRMGDLPEATQREARLLLERESDVRDCFQVLRNERIMATRIRHHGNYHLGEVLYTGKDFLIIDFEGNPGRPMSERRLKHSGFRDVASMIRSLHYASHAALYGKVPGIVPSGAALPELEKWARAWYRSVSAGFVRGYLERAGNADLMPQSREQRRAMIIAFVLEKALQDVEYEAEHRPDWARLPIRGIIDLLAASHSSAMPPEQKES